MAQFAFTAVILSSWLIIMSRSARSEARSYTAAVYEHRVLLNPQPAVAVGRKAALEHMNKNLDVFEEQTAAAATQGAQIIVFPEDAIHGFNYTRSSIAGYLETVPDPAVVTWSPCTDPERFPNTEVLRRLSCIAQKNQIFLVANMPDRQPCDRSTDPFCPPDNQYQFNTDVVFGDNGAIVARYHKHNLYFEVAFDTPPKCEYVTFTTPFAGRFGMFTCFDILFKEPAVTLVKNMGIRQLVYPTAWMNQLPLLAAVQFQRSFSYSAGVTLLAANIRAGEFGMTGSGIFTPWDAVYHHATEGEMGKLLVHRVPVLDESMFGNSDTPIPKLVPFSGHRGAEVEHSFPFLSNTEFCFNQGCQDEFQTVPPTPFTSTMMYDTFTLVPLQGRRGNLTVCDGSLCCNLLFQRSTPPKEELYALGAFDGLHVVHGTYYLEVCALVRCSSHHGASCGGETKQAETLVDFELYGTFSTEHVYSGVLGNAMALERPDYSGWYRNGRFYMVRKGMKIGLVTAVLYGRVYEKDNVQPPQS